MRIELVGGLGIGKSTLCRALDQAGFNCIYENLKTNPFLSDCFQNPSAFRFPSQMWFVLSKYHEILKYEQPERLNVLDQSVLNVKAYTYMLFNGEDHEALGIIQQCFKYMEKQTGEPDLLIHLKCSPEEQLRRIRGRNRDHEKGVELDYIRALQAQLDRLLRKAEEEGQMIMEIDTESTYLPDNVDYAHDLADRLSKILSFDPDIYLPVCRIPQTSRRKDALIAAE